MPVNDIVIRIGGESGEGIVTIGEIFVRIAAFSGLDVYTFRTFPAEIIGGHVIFQARIADHPALSQGDDIDVLVALNQEGYDNHVNEVKSGGTLSTTATAPRRPSSAMVTSCVPFRCPTWRIR